MFGFCKKKCVVFATFRIRNHGNSVISVPSPNFVTPSKEKMLRFLTQNSLVDRSGARSRWSFCCPERGTSQERNEKIDRHLGLGHGKKTSTPAPCWIQTDFLCGGNTTRAAHESVAASSDKHGSPTQPGPLNPAPQLNPLTNRGGCEAPRF